MKNVITTNYKPRPIDIDWAKTMIAQIKDGGILAYPATALIYRLHKDTKSLELLNTEILTEAGLENDHSTETHRRTVLVFKEIGWKVTP